MMGTTRRERRERQEEATDSENVWIENPDGGALIIVKKSDLDDEGHLIKEDEEDGGE